ncbi:phage tail protein [Macrococcoides bohemicum]|uniref:Phage tail protein n=2 Tax=Macrococcoides bohemicum TaxID=1903056 RepID=A0A328A7W0_9STAP|nr:phage tail protein [Macrococcus bohemicus]
MTSFLKTGKNIFHTYNSKQGKSVSNTTGEHLDSIYYIATDYLPVLPGTQYTQNFGEVVAFYDINKVFISGIAKATTVKASRSFTTPANAYYIITSSLKEGVDTYSYKGYQIEKGAASTPYEPFYYYAEGLKPGLIDESVLNQHIKSGTIGIEKLAIVETSINKFDKSKVTSGYYVNPTTGALSANASYVASDFINVSGQTKVTKSNTNNLYAFYDVNKQFISNTNTNTNTVTVPANAAYIRISDSTTNINNTMLVYGDTLPGSYVAYQSYIPSRYLESSAGVVEGSYGKDNLKTYVSDISKQLNPNHNQRTELGVIGDSWVQGGEFKAGDRLTLPLRNRMKSLYGDGGVGYVGLANGHVGNGDVSVSLTGTWQHYDEGLGNIAQSKGLDSAMVESSTAGDSIKVTFNEELDFYEIHTLNTGQWRYNVDGGSWTTIDAANQQVTPISMTLAKHTINIEIVSGLVTFIGSYAYKGNKGIVIHKMGNGGLKASHIASTDRTNWVNQMKKCRANTFGILLGTNDMAQSVPISDYERDMKEVISRIREAKPLASIFLIAPSGNNITGKLHTIDAYSDAQLKIAKELNIAHVSLFRTLGDFSTTDANGLMYSDGVHPTANGGYAISNIIYDRLLRI